MPAGSRARPKEYHEVVTEAARAAPDDLELLIEAQSAHRYVCDWDGFEQHQPRLLAALKHVLETPIGQNIPPGILNYLGMDDLDCIEREQYIEKAVALAMTSAELAAVKDWLENARQASDYFAPKAFALTLEEAIANGLGSPCGGPAADICAPR